MKRFDFTVAKQRDESRALLVTYGEPPVPVTVKHMAKGRLGDEIAYVRKDDGTLLEVDPYSLENLPTPAYKIPAKIVLLIRPGDLLSLADPERRHAFLSVPAFTLDRVTEAIAQKYTGPEGVLIEVDLPPGLTLPGLPSPAESTVTNN